MSILVTGGMGFIGSHTVVELLTSGYEVIIVDNLSNSKRSVLDAITHITSKEPLFIQGDITNEGLVAEIFSQYTIQGVIHFAAKKAVGESCENPRKYYEENIGGLVTLTKVMNNFGCTKIVFSSSCTVYDPEKSNSPFTEEAPTGNNFSPYGTTKYVNELLLRDLSLHRGFSAINLRYFNPIGAHASGLLGEDPSQQPTNVLPVIFQVLTGKRPYLQIFGDTYDTPDGTCLRDYIHVVDLAKAHIAAWERLVEQEQGTVEEVNLGTGLPTSVKELVAIVEKVTTQNVKVDIVEPRSGDIPIAYAGPGKAKMLLHREAQLGVEDAVKDGRNFISHHFPN